MGSQITYISNELTTNLEVSLILLKFDHALRKMYRIPESTIFMVIVFKLEKVTN